MAPTSSTILFTLVTLFLFIALPLHARNLMTHHVREAVHKGQAKSLGRLPAAQPMQLDIVLPLKDRAGLHTFLQQLYDPSSPSYRHFLTVQEFTQRFGPTQEDYDAVVQFAKANGFMVVGGSRDRMDVQLKGTVASVEKAFHVNMGLYKHAKENRTFYASDREPTVDLPVSLWHISGLDNYSIPHPLHNKKQDSQTNLSVQSNATTGSCPETSFCGSDMRAAYYGGTLTGSGQSIGLLEYYGYEISDLDTYYTNSGQTRTATVTGVSTDGTDLGCTAAEGCDDTEQILDMTQALGMAPGIDTLYVFVGSSDTAIFAAMTTATPLPAELSCSWAWIPADPETADPYFERMAAQGQSFFAASGDWGAWVSGEFVYPGEDSSVISVGGTDLTTDSAGDTWRSETGWDFGGGGISPDNIPIPFWQQAAGVITSLNQGSTLYRNGPDVSANADFSFYVCANQGTCTANQYGGTSFAAPMWAGYIALANQQAAAVGQPAVGFINPSLYAIGLSPRYQTDFHDVARGDNGFLAGIGFDLQTGWGSPNGANLINDLTTSSPVFFIWAPGLSVPQGGTGSVQINTSAIGGFNSDNSLTATDQPAGVTVNLSPTSIAAPGSGSSIMTVQAAPTAALGNYTLTITGTGGGTTQTNTVALTVSGPATHFAVNAPSSVPFNVPFNFEVMAEDELNNVSTGYSGTVRFTSSDALAVLPPNSTLTNGKATFSAKLYTGGTQTITAADTVSGTIAAASANTLVKLPTHFALSLPTLAGASVAAIGDPFTFYASALDDYGNYATGYNGTVHFTSTDPLAVLPPDGTLIKGTGRFTATLNTEGTQTLTLTDTVNATMTGSGVILAEKITAMPAFSPGPDTYTAPQLVTLSDRSPGVTIYYTTDGSTPTTASTVYTGPIAVPTTTTIEAIAAGNGYPPSPVAFGIYNIIATTPTFSPAPVGTFYTPQSVAILDATPGVTIYYTTDGSTPTTASTPYTGPIPVSISTTIKAIAVGNGYGASTVAIGPYILVAAAPTFLPAPIGPFSGPQSVTLADRTPGVTIFYTTDGSTPTTASTVYSGAIPVSTTTTINVIAAENGYQTSAVASATYTLVAATPTFSPGPMGTFTGPQSVTLKDSSPDVTIYYTTDGSTPTTASTVYSGAIPVSTTTTINAIAAKSGYQTSAVASGTYVLVAATPTFSPAPIGTFSGPQSVTLKDATAGVTIYYTTDGSTPTTASTRYTGAFTVSKPTTVNAIAVGNGYAASGVGNGTYSFAAATPTFSPGAYGTFSTPVSLKLSDGSPSVAIYYTTDGSTPTTASTLYTGAFTVSTTTTLKAIAVGNGYAASGVAIGTYTFVAATPTFSPGAYGTFSAPLSVKLSGGSPSVPIYYTTDGSTPTSASTLYSGPIAVKTTTTIKAIAVGNGYGASGVTSGTYTLVAAPPTFSPAAGTFSTPVSLKLSDGSPSVAIYYTTDGSTPTTASTLYTGAFTVSTTTTIKAIATGNGCGTSSVASANYLISAK